MKKAQVHMTETIAVLFIFFILVVFGLVFYYKYQQNAIEMKQQELFAQRAVDTGLQTLFLSELRCSKGNAEAEDNCIDIHKLSQAHEIMSPHNSYYFDLFGYASIKVHQVYPEVEDSGVRDWVVYDFPKENANFKPTYFVITLKNETGPKDQFNYGYLEVGVYS